MGNAQINAEIQQKQSTWSAMEHLRNMTNILTKSEAIDITNTVLAVVSLALVVGSMGYNIYHLTHLDELNKNVEEKLLVVNQNIQENTQVAVEQQKTLQMVQQNQRQLALSMTAPR